VRVLWLTSVMPPAVTAHLGMMESRTAASWIESLRQVLTGNDDLELAISCPSPAPFAPFRRDGVTYYGMPESTPRTRFARAASGWLSSLNLQDTTQASMRVVRHFSPHIIHVHGTENPYGLIAAECGIPVLVSLQGLLTVYERFYFHGLTTHEMARLTLRKDSLLGRGAIQGYWRCVRMAERERRILRLNRFFAGRTQWDEAVLRLINPSAAYRHCDEVLREPFYEAEWRQDQAHPRTVFCTSSTLLPKRAESLIEALALLHEAGYTDVRLRIAGVPAQGLDDDFHQTRAMRHGVSRYVESLGQLDANQLVAELLGAAVFAYPSHIDNSPNALCEALLVGVPTVASYVGGVPSLLKDGREGLLYPDGDAYALAGQLRHLLDDPAYGADLARQARTRAQQRHQRDKIVTTLLGIYHELLTQRT